MKPSGLAIAMIQRFLPSRSRGGAGHFAHGLANALVGRGHGVTVFSHDPAPPGAGYQMVVVPSGVSRVAPLEFPFQVARRDFSSFDVIHAQGDNQLLRRRGTPPVVRTLHGSAWAEALHNGWRLRSPGRFAMHAYFYLWDLVAVMRADAVVGVSGDTGHYYPRVTTVIPNGVDLERLQRSGEPKSPRPSVLFVGELNTRKRGVLLLRVFREAVRPRLPDAELWLVCPERVEGDGIRWIESPDDERLGSLYRQAWVFCLPSSYEGFGRPYAEALAAGTPVVATPNAGALEVLDEGRYGVIARDHELGPSLCALLGDRTRRDLLGRQGLERARIYAWDRVARAYEAVFESVLPAARRARRASAAGGRMR